MSDIIEKCKKNFRIMVCKVARKYYLNKLTGKIGETVVYDDKIVCYVKQDLLDKTLRGRYSIYELSLYGGRNNPEDKEMMKWYGLDKPFYYVFDNIKFRSCLKFSSFNASVIFKNCEFRNNIGIFWAENVTFENNKYYNWGTHLYYGNSFLYGKVYGILKFVDDNFVNSYEYKRYGDNKFGMSVTVGKLEIVNSKIEIEFLGDVDIEAREMEFINSEINAPEVYIDSKSMKVNNGGIVASKGVIINNESQDLGICNIKSPYLVYNDDVILNKNTDLVIIDTKFSELKYDRLKLLEQLRKIRDFCNEENDKIIQQLKNGLDSQKVGKVLSKVKK